MYVIRINGIFPCWSEVDNPGSNFSAEHIEELLFDPATPVRNLNN